MCVRTYVRSPNTYHPTNGWSSVLPQQLSEKKTAQQIRHSHSLVSEIFDFLAPARSILRDFSLRFFTLPYAHQSSSPFLRALGFVKTGIAHCMLFALPLLAGSPLTVVVWDPAMFISDRTKVAGMSSPAASLRAAQKGSDIHFSGVLESDGGTK